MSYRPPRRLERLAGLLLPPANAEPILGDITECSESNQSFVANLFAVLPGAVWCQIRRRCNRGVTIFNALLSAYVMGAMQAWLHNSYLGEPWAWLRLAAPFAIWVCGGMLSSAYGPASKPNHASCPGFIATVILTLATAALLGVPVTGVAAALLVVIGFWVLVLVLFGMPFIKYGTPGPLSTDTLLQHARLFQSGIWWRNLRESLAGLVVLALQVRAFFEWPDPMTRVTKILLIAGVLFILGFLNLYARPHRVPEAGTPDAVLRFHRAELVRQRNILRAVPLWYLFPILPGMLLGLAADWQGIPSVVGLMIIAAVFALIWWLNRGGANHLEKQVKELDELSPSLQ
jgi:hypothetical protein